MSEAVRDVTDRQRRLDRELGQCEKNLQISHDEESRDALAFFNINKTFNLFPLCHELTIACVLLRSRTDWRTDHQAQPRRTEVPR